MYTLKVSAVLALVAGVIILWLLISEHLENACHPCPKCGKNTLRTATSFLTYRDRVRDKVIISKCRSCGHECEEFITDPPPPEAA